MVAAMHTNWSAAAHAHIAKVIATLPPEASLEDKRLAPRRSAQNFHCGTSWGKKIWGRECKKYMGMIGHPLAKARTDPRLAALREAGEISFPFAPIEAGTGETGTGSIAEGDESGISVKTRIA